MTSDRSYSLPPLGHNPSTTRDGTTPGSFANPPRIGTPYSFSSPDTPGMPPPSPMTALDFAKPSDADGKTQLKEARAVRIPAEWLHAPSREPHLTPEQIRLEVAAGRM